MIWLIIAAVYLIGAGVTVFICRYFDYEPPLVGVVICWPFCAVVYLVVGALLPFIWIAERLYDAGSALRGRP